MPCKTRLSLLFQSDREQLCLYAALEIESELFWTSITSKGFGENVDAVSKAAKQLTSSHKWLDTFPKSDSQAVESVMLAMERAVKYKRLHAKEQSKYARMNEEESD